MYHPPEQPGIIDGRLLHACFRESERCEMVSLSLEGLRNALVESFHAHMTALAEEIRSSGSIIRGLADRSQVHHQRAPIVLQYLDVIIPCLSRSLHDINGYIEDRTSSKEIRWRRMYNKMTEESELREKRGIPMPPAPSGPLVRSEMALVPMIPEPDAHWSEQIFSLPLPSRTTLKNHRRKFDNDSLALIAYLNPANKAPYLIMQTYHMGSQWFSTRGVHELCIQRNQGAVELRRWSRSEGVAKLWATLHFITWEALKAQNTLTLEVEPDEYILKSERRLFQAQIIDDGYKHSLIVYEDTASKGMRLHAAVWEGELQQCPVWTAFSDHASMQLANLPPNSEISLPGAFLADESYRFGN
ncbi:unnamed protein product [Parascedosporium putredinis]|uniref:Uncharacterized protein n=1 Tax=Parascedosporium putredinis TaxID=1442378 RepID=A0A9P1H610_9PEZI|nr:unnamed protein product [Parascedosporium putredinis]CAI7998418.1 unnamed protein product [Parascedosporium putredinis]